jgi:hypothetical protein
VDFVAKFDKINPFPLIDYFFGFYPALPPGYSFEPAGPDEDDAPVQLTSAEEEQLRKIFAHHDKSGDDKIDLQELGGMLAELGAKVSEEEVQAGMTDLDTNNDGTCCFEEFKNWWQAKDARSSTHHSFALKFLKQKMKVSKMLTKMKRKLSGATAYLGPAPVVNPDDTYIKFQQEITPGMVECDAKMSIDLKLEKSSKTITVDGDSKYSPESEAKFVAKSDSDARDVAAAVQTLLSCDSIAPVFAMMSLPAPQAVADGSTVSVKWTPPSAIVGQAYNQEAAQGPLRGGRRASECRYGFRLYDLLGI